MEVIRRIKLESTLRKAKKLCKSKRDFDYFIKGLRDERDYRELMRITASSYWDERKRKAPIQPPSEQS